MGVEGAGGREGWVCATRFVVGRGGVKGGGDGSRRWMGHGVGGGLEGVLWWRRREWSVGGAVVAHWWLVVGGVAWVRKRGE